MSIEYVTFVGKDLQGNVLDVVVATVIDALDESIAAQDQFGPGTPASGIPVIALPSGTYFINVVADGYRFPYRHQFTILPGEGPTGDTPKIVEVEATSSTQPPSSSPVEGPLPKCRVFGWIERPSPNTRYGVERQAHGTTYDDGPTRFTTTVAHTVWFERVGPLREGEQRSLLDKARTRVSVDRNGYYSAELSPNALYRVTMPNVVGYRYFRTPDPATEAPVEELIQSQLTEPLYDLV